MEQPYRFSSQDAEDPDAIRNGDDGAGAGRAEGEPHPSDAFSKGSEPADATACVDANAISHAEDGETRQGATAAAAGLYPTPVVELEQGRLAVECVMSMSNATLLDIMLRATFRPVRDDDLVPVTPCSHCYDGGLRTAGSVRTHGGRELVRVCDTCGVVEIGDIKRG